MILAPNCPECLEPMQLHPRFPIWWCESCRVQLAPEDTDPVV